MNDRRAQKCMKGFFTDLRDVVKTRMLRCIVEVNGFRALTDETDKPFVLAERQHTDTGFVQAFGRHEAIAFFFRVVQINRRHLGTHRIAHARDNHLQRGGDVRRGTDFLNDAPQGIQHSHTCSPSQRRAAAALILSARGGTHRV